MELMQRNGKHHYLTDSYYMIYFTEGNLVKRISYDLTEPHMDNEGFMRFPAESRVLAKTSRVNYGRKILMPPCNYGDKATQRHLAQVLKLSPYESFVRTEKYEDLFTREVSNEKLNLKNLSLEKTAKVLVSIRLDRITDQKRTIVCKKPFTGVYNNVLMIADKIIGILYGNSFFLAYGIYPKVKLATEDDLYRSFVKSGYYCKKIMLAESLMENYEKRKPVLINKNYLGTRIYGKSHYNLDYMIELSDKIYTALFSYPKYVKERFSNPLFAKLLQKQKVFLGPSFVLKEVDRPSKLKWKYIKLITFGYESAIYERCGSLARDGEKLYYDNDTGTYEVIATGIEPRIFKIHENDFCFRVYTG